MADIFQTLIEQIQFDPDFPAGAVCTALPANATINVRYEKTDAVDQWQIAIPISTPVDDAIDQIADQHQRAINRVIAARYRAQRDNAERAAQVEYHRAMKDLTDNYAVLRKSKRAAIKARHEKVKK